MFHFPPYYILEKGAPPGGILTEIVEKTMLNAGVEYELFAFPPKRLYMHLTSGEIDMFTGIKGGKEYHDAVVYSKKPITSSQVRIYAKSGQSIPQNLVGLHGKNLGLIRGFGYGGRRKALSTADNLKFISNITSHRSALKMLERGHIDYLLQYSNAMDAVLEREGPVSLAFVTLETVQVYFMLNKNMLEVDELMEILEKSVASLKNTDLTITTK